MKYIGDGTLIPGVPPRDLSEAEVLRFGAMIAEVDAARVAAGMGALYVADEGRRTKDEGRKTKDEGRRTKEGPSEFQVAPGPDEEKSA